MSNKRNLGEQITEVLRERIIAGLVPMDVALRQDALAQEFGISKIPLREAFARLERDGLVVSEANRGFFVRPLSPEEAFDVFDLRLKIEPDAVAAAAKRATARDHVVADRALRALNEATLACGDASHRIGALNRAFHIALIGPARRAVTLKTIERLQVIAERYVIKHLEPKERRPRAVGEHEALFRAWANGNGNEASAISRAHIRETLEDLRRELAGS